MLKIIGKKILTIYAEKMWLSKPMALYITLLGIKKKIILCKNLLVVLSFYRTAKGATRGLQVPGRNEVRSHRSTQPLRYLCSYCHEGMLLVLYQ